MKSWIVELEKDPDTNELILPLSDEMLAELGWKNGDVIEWIDNHDGTWSVQLRKATLLTKIKHILYNIRNKFTRSKDGYIR